MASKVSNMVEYSGISTAFPSNPTAFKQIAVNSLLCIPSNKPDIERILKVNTSIKIDSVDVIQTPTGTSLEGQILTGYKAIVHGHVKYLVIYSAKSNSQSLHSAHFEVPFCDFIVLPSTYIKSTPVGVAPYIEDVCIENVISECPCDSIERCVPICATIFLNAQTCCNEPKQKKCCSDECCVKIVGISNNLPTTLTYFKEFIADQDLIIDNGKPTVCNLISLSSQFSVESMRLVSTISGTSLEGQTLSGCKLAVTLQTKDIAVYSACESCRAVHSATFNSKLCCAYIILPCTISGSSVSQLVSNGNIVVTPYVENICATIKNQCTINKCSTLLLNVTTKCV